MRKILEFNQWDERWKDMKLGSSGLSCGRYGCYSVTVACGLRSFFYRTDVDPKTFIEKMNAVGGYDADGQLVWSAIPKAFPGTELILSAWTSNAPGKNLQKEEITSAIRRIQALNRRGQIVGLCVDRVANDGITPDHIVLAGNTPADLTQWTIMDPDGGKLMNFVERYGSPLTGVMGYRIVGGVSAAFPDDATGSDSAIGAAIGQCLDSRYGKRDVLMQLMKN